MKIGILVCGKFSDTIMSKYSGVYEDFFIDGLKAADSALEFASYWVFEDQFPSSVKECDGWVVTGSKNGVYENLPWMVRLQDIIGKAYDHDIPVFGVCFGHQIIAQALGGHVEKADAGWGLGYQEYDLLEPMAHIDGNLLKLYAIHQDQVVKVPPKARVIAKTDHCPVAGLAYEGRAMSLQPHPEFSKQFETDLIMSINGESFPSEVGNSAIASLENTSVDNNKIMKMMVGFFRDDG